MPDLMHHTQIPHTPSLSIENLEISSASTLKLSKNIISLVFRLPFEARLDSQSKWHTEPRTGQSPLYASLAYLSSPTTPWNHSVVGWPGEIDVSTSDTAKTDGAGSVKRLSSSLNAPTQFQNTVLSANRRRELAERLERDCKANIVPVWLATDPINDDIIFIKNNDEKKLALRNQLRWSKYCEEELFHILHYKQIPQDTPHKVARQYWTDYVKMNKAFASKVLEIYHPGDIIIIHNFELMLVPAILRQRLPKAYIGCYLHTPFPTSEIYRCLPTRKETLEGLLGANMVGFQSYGYSRHFASCCTRILGVECSSTGVSDRGNHVGTDVFPTGIDSNLILQTAFSKEVDDQVAATRNRYRGKRIIVGRDRLDRSCGISQKLEAFELFLDRYPEWQGKCVLIQITGSTRDRNPVLSKESVQYFFTITDLIDRINSRFGSTDYTPVCHYPAYVPQHKYFGLLRAADACIISSIRDGMNTTALEYVLCQRDTRNPLLLSEFSGTSAALTAAIHINPWDFSGVAESIVQALNYDQKEKAAKHEQLFNYVKTNSIQAWTDKYLNRLITNLSSFDQSTVTPVMDRNKLLSQYKKSKFRLFLFDYDGTLTPIVQDPQAATPSDKMIRTIKTLSSDPNNAVWIISGRDQEFLDEWMGDISQLGFSAEHGSFLRYPNQNEWLNLASQMDMGWQEKVKEIMDRYTDRTQGSFVEKKKIALSWHYRRSDPDDGATQAKACRDEIEATVASRWDVEVMSGKKVVEARPKFLNKGEIVRQLLDYYNQLGRTPGLVFCVGDDVTDENMFSTLRASTLPPDQIFSCTVGASSKETTATYHLNDPSDVIATVALLNSSVGR